MYWNYLKTGFRNLSRNKLFSVINIAGFSVGLAISFLIVLWITYEVGFDNFHKNAKSTYRVITTFERNGSSDNFANTPAPLGPALKEEYPEVLEYVRTKAFSKCLASGYKPAILKKYFLPLKVLFFHKVWLKNISQRKVLLGKPFLLVSTISKFIQLQEFLRTFHPIPSFKLISFCLFAQLGGIQGGISGIIRHIFFWINKMNLKACKTNFHSLYQNTNQIQTQNFICNLLQKSICFLTCDLILPPMYIIQSWHYMLPSRLWYYCLLQSILLIWVWPNQRWEIKKSE